MEGRAGGQLRPVDEHDVGPAALGQVVGDARPADAAADDDRPGVFHHRSVAEKPGRIPSWHEVGSLRLESCPERLEELTRQAGWAKTFGLPLVPITAAEAQARFPLMAPDGVLGAV